MVPRRRSTIASCGGPSAGYGRPSSARWRVPKVCPTDCSSTAPASKSTARPEAQEGALANGIGLTRGGRNTKVHALCDAKGRPCVLMITPGNVHDIKVAKVCHVAVCLTGRRQVCTKLVEKGYDSNDSRIWLAERGITAVIPSKRNRKIQLDCDPAIYR